MLAYGLSAICIVMLLKEAGVPIPIPGDLIMLERVAGTLRRGGGVAVAVAMITPGLRSATIAASGVANISFGTFFPALVVGDTIFFLLHVAIGYAGGKGSRCCYTGSISRLAVSCLSCWACCLYWVW